MKVKVATFSLKGKANIWWEDLKNLKGIREEELSWKEFEEYFRNKYLSKICFNNKAKDLYELRLRQMTDNE